MSVSLKTLIEGYIAARERPSDVPGRLDFWLQALGDVPITEISADSVDAAMVRLAERGKVQPRRNQDSKVTGKPLAGSTLTRYVSQLAGVFKYARKQRLVPRTWTPPTRGMDLPAQAPIKTKYFTAADVERLVRVARMFDTRWKRMPCALCTVRAVARDLPMRKARYGLRSGMTCRIPAASQGTVTCTLIQVNG